MKTEEPDILSDLETRKQLHAHVAALKDQGQEWEDSLLASFLSSIEHRVDRLVDQRVSERLRDVQKRRGSDTGRLAICLAFAIPLLAIAASAAGLTGVLAVMGGLVLLNTDLLSSL